MSPRRARFLLLSGLLLQSCMLGGGQDVGQRTTHGGGSAPPITVDELDQITKSFADRYVLLLANACDEIKRLDPSPAARLNAHQLKLSAATAAFDAATGPDPVMQLVDLAVGVGLQKIVWVDEGQAGRMFGDEPGGRLLSEALARADEDLWRLCMRVMRPEQIDALRDSIREWRRENPGPRWIADARFDLVAGRKAAGLIEGIAGSLSPAGGSVTDSIGQARLLGQRVFYYLKRLPRLVDWQAEAALENAASIPEAGEALQGASAALRSAAGLLNRLERFLTAPSEEEGEEALADVHQILIEARALVEAVRGTVHAFAELRPPKDKPASTPPKPDAKPREEEGAQPRPFDIREYTAAGAQFSQALREATVLLREGREWAVSGPSMRRVEDMVDVAARRMSREGLRAVDRAAWRIAQLLVLAAVLVSLCAGLLLRLRSRRHGANPPPAAGPAPP
jgi:hypothetical protein